MTDYTLLINNLRGAAKVEDIALFQECTKMGFVSDEATTFSTNGKLLREAADALASLQRELEEAKEQIAGARAMMILGWPPPLKDNMPDGTLPAQLRAYIDAEIYARRDEEGRMREAIQAVPLPSGHDAATFIRYRTAILEASGLSSAASEKDSI